jgi:Spy/CpxP family protein refolding chaperone
MQALRTELMDRIHAEEFDEGAIRDAAAAAAEAHADIAVEQARLRQQIQLLLTPEQREQAEEMFRRHREFMEEDGRGSGGERRFHHRQHRHGPQKDLDD